MSIILCETCEDYVDTDISIAFFHKNGKTYCFECAQLSGFKEPEDGEYCG
jgi:hypothetical protein